MFISVNKATLTDCTPEEYERFYQEACDYMAKQPGHIRQRLVRSDSEPGVYFAISEWESVEAYRRLATIDELVEIFGQVISLTEPRDPSKDKIVVEHHDCSMVLDRERV
ncbi:antibiotic biosynthesis monooxygenase [Micromonospora sp. KC723]|uniref:antibiotic biosynthesis monooxygenase family protein n=1 Tax=Micromonospora sp. KC723 TaxID=2530381 RepID=UPI001046F642|nr:antibiotic biosynthesis monooxygenase family protein [Micromonospora sp. KC723]TDB78123.1 hypothetical protein E1165_01945 [Micromonospora sp. KC723]